MVGLRKMPTTSLGRALAIMAAITLITLIIIVVSAARSVKLGVARAVTHGL